MAWGDMSSMTGDDRPVEMRATPRTAGTRRRTGRRTSRARDGLLDEVLRDDVEAPAVAGAGAR